MIFPVDKLISVCINNFKILKIKVIHTTHIVGNTYGLGLVWYCQKNSNSPWHYIYLFLNLYVATCLDYYSLFWVCSFIIFTFLLCQVRCNKHVTQISWLRNRVNFSSCNYRGFRLFLIRPNSYSKQSRLFRFFSNLTARESDAGIPKYWLTMAVVVCIYI